GVDVLERLGAGLEALGEDDVPGVGGGLARERVRSGNRSERGAALAHPAARLGEDAPALRPTRGGTRRSRAALERRAAVPRALLDDDLELGLAAEVAPEQIVELRRELARDHAIGD